MKIGIIGAGAIGLLVASYMAKTTHHVTLYTNSSGQAELIQKNGLLLERGQHIESIQCHVKHLNRTDNLSSLDVVFVAVKQYDLDSLIPLLKYGLRTVVFLQNGMSHLHKLDYIKAEALILGIMEHGAKKKSPFHVEHTGIGMLKLGVFSGEKDTAEKICHALLDSSFAVSVVENWLETLESKLIANVCINPLTAMFRVNNGKLLENEHLASLVRLLFDEAIEALNKDNSEELWRNVEEIIRNTAKNRSSMLSDINANRKTEIDAITGYILLRGGAIKMPHNQFVYNSVKALELEREEVL